MDEEEEEYPLGARADLPLPGVACEMLLGLPLLGSFFPRLQIGFAEDEELSDDDVHDLQDEVAREQGVLDEVHRGRLLRLDLFAAELERLVRVVHHGDATLEEKKALESEPLEQRAFDLGLGLGAAVRRPLANATRFVKHLSKPGYEVPVGMHKGHGVGEHRKARRVRFAHVDVELGKLEMMLLHYVLVRGGHD